MIAKLTKELADALNATGDCEVEFVDPETQRTYFLVDGETHRLAMEALRRQRDRDAIAEGLVQMEGGRANHSTRHSWTCDRDLAFLERNEDVSGYPSSVCRSGH